MVEVTLLPTLVTTEWTSTVASHLNELQASTCSAQLWQEAALLEQLIYKNINQHRNTRPFQRLLEVRRLLRLLKEISTDDSLCALRDALSLCSRPTLSLHERNVPTAQSALRVLHRVLGSCRVAELLADATLVVAFQYTTQLAQSFFMPLSLTCLAIVARLRALGAQLLVDLIRIYNCCVELIALLPVDDFISSDDEKGDGNKKINLEESELFSSRLAKLPQMLRCSWTDGKPTVIKVSTSHNNSRKGDFSPVQRPQRIASAIPARRREELAGIKRKGTAAASAVSDLAVIEDRGVVVSREHLMAELRQNATQAVVVAHKTALGLDEQTPPEYARTEVNLSSTGASGAGGKVPLLKKKVEKQNKKGGGPKIIIIPDDNNDGGSGGGARSLKQSVGAGSSAGPSIKVSKPQLERIPPRTTAFISVESLQKRPRIEEGKEEEKKAAVKVVGPPPAAAAIAKATTASTNFKSWEDWLAPLGSNEKKQQQQPKFGSNSKKKTRRR